MDPMRRVLALTSACLFFSGLLFAKDITIRGFVTDVKSPGVFEIDDYKVTRDRSVELNANPENGELDRRR